MGRWPTLSSPLKTTITHAARRYKTDVEEAIEDLPIQRKVEMYQDLQKQVRAGRRALGRCEWTNSNSHDDMTPDMAHRKRC